MREFQNVTVQFFRFTAFVKILFCYMSYIYPIDNINKVTNILF